MLQAVLLLRVGARQWVGRTIGAPLDPQAGTRPLDDLMFQSVRTKFMCVQTILARLSVRVDTLRQWGRGRKASMAEATAGVAYAAATALADRQPVGRRQRGHIRSRFKDALLRQLVARLLASMWGQPVMILLMRNLQLRLTLQELAFLFLQNHRIFSRMPASLYTQRQIQNYSWRWGAVALYLAVSLRDPALLIAWLQNRIRKITLFQHRRFFRTLAVSLKGAIYGPTPRYRLRGMRLQVTGKISVTGNSMSRTYFLRAGQQSNSSMSYQLAQGFTLIRTRTGCLGLWLGFYF